MEEVKGKEEEKKEEEEERKKHLLQSEDATPISRPKKEESTFTSCFREQI